MAKSKTKKAAEKRFTITKKGKILHRHQMASHLKIQKRKYRLYRQKRIAHLSKAEEKKVRRLLPYT